MIIGLQLEHRKMNPPSFPESLLLLRTEEDRHAAKMDRMKKHLGSTKAAAHVHSVLSQLVFDEEPIIAVSKKAERSSKLEREVAELRKQITQLMHKERTELKHEGNASSSTRMETPLQSESLAARVAGPPMSQTPTQPRPWFCFKCGEDGHIAANCTNEPNPGLVRKKNAELREKRNRFWAQQRFSGLSLNL